MAKHRCGCDVIRGRESEANEAIASICQGHQTTKYCTIEEVHRLNARRAKFRVDEGLNVLII